MYNKRCRKCLVFLPLDAFTSTRAKYCKNCLIIVRLEQQKAMQSRAIEKLKLKKPKKHHDSVADHKKRTQKKVNAYVRLRDKDLPCISCQGYCGEWNAGHFIAQGSTGFLRFDLDNIHKQGIGCNKWKHGNLLEYRIHLKEKIGEKKVEWLEEHRHDVKKWTHEELNEIEEQIDHLTILLIANDEK